MLCTAWPTSPLSSWRRPTSRACSCGSWRRPPRPQGPTRGDSWSSTAPTSCELLSATSHRAADLEAWQVGAGFGPCVACMEEVSTVSATAVEAAEVWPEFAEQMTTAGYRHVLATPLRWQGAALGGLNLFWHEELSTDAGTSLTVAQAFADALTLGVLAVRPVSVQEARTRLDDALRGRVVIERAKGVLAHEHQLSMEAAFERLLEISEERAEPLGRTALQVVKRAQDGGRSSS